MLGTIVLVVLVIFLFLRRFVATVIPTLSLPVSLVGAVSLLWAFGYTPRQHLAARPDAGGRPGRRRRDRHAREHHAPRRGRRAAVQAALRGSREVGFTIISISSSLVAVFIPIFFMPGVIGLLFHEFAVIVVAGHRRLGVRLADAGADAGEPLPERRGAQASRRARSCAAFERGFDATARRLHALARRRACAIAASCCCVGAAHASSRPAWLFVTIPKGFFPEEDIGQISISTEAAEDISFPAMVRLQDARRRGAARRPGGGDGQLVQRRSGSSGSQNVGRMFINLKPRGERAADEAGGRGPAHASCARCPASASSCGRSRTCSSAAARARRSTSTSCRACRPASSTTGRCGCRSTMRADPLFRDVTSDSQLQRPAGVAEDRPRPRQHARRVDRRRSARRCSQRLRRAPGVDHLHRGRQLPGDHGGRAGREAGRSAFNNIYVRSSTGALVPLSSFATVERSVGPTSINHVGQLQAVTVSFNLAPGAALGDATAQDREVPRPDPRCRRRSSPATAAMRRCSRARRAARRS